MKSSFIALLLMLLSAAGVYAQRLSHQVLLPAAGLATAGDITYQQTIGETAVEICVQYPYTLTQGFQQPSYEPGTVDPDPTEYGISVWPNPVSTECDNELTVDINSSELRSYIVVIFNFSGSIMYSWRSGVKLEGYYTRTIPMDNFCKGIYIVRVLSTDDKVDLSFKIEKL